MSLVSHCLCLYRICAVFFASLFPSLWQVLSDTRLDPCDMAHGEAVSRGSRVWHPMSGNQKSGQKNKSAPPPIAVHCLSSASEHCSVQPEMFSMDAPPTKKIECCCPHGALRRAPRVASALTRGKKCSKTNVKKDENHEKNFALPLLQRSLSGGPSAFAPLPPPRPFFSPNGSRRSGRGRGGKIPTRRGAHSLSVCARALGEVDSVQARPWASGEGDRHRRRRPFIHECERRIGWCVVVA